MYDQDVGDGCNYEMDKGTHRGHCGREKKKMRVRRKRGEDAVIEAKRVKSFTNEDRNQLLRRAERA